MNEKQESVTATARVFEELAAATKLYREYLQLAQLGDASGRRAAEIRSYERTWSHPLGMVLHKK